MDPVPLNFTSFFTDYIFHPEHAKLEDQDKCFYISLSLGILSLGVIPAVVGIAWGVSNLLTYLKGDLSDQDVKIQIVAKENEMIKSEPNNEKEAGKEEKLEPSNVVLKTPVEELKLNKINPFKIDFKIGSNSRTAAQQAQEVLGYFDKFFSSYPEGKIAITYSSNSDQAQSIYKGYKTGQYTISGANQAQVFSTIVAGIKERNLQDKVHVLPIPTCLHSGGKEISSNEDINLAMKNIAQHLKDGWYVLGLQNQSTKPDFPFAIGGGVAGVVWKEGTTQRDFCQTQMLRMLNGDIPTEEELNSQSL